jgi:hypothetical protein
MNDTFLHIIGAFQKTFSEIFCATDNVFRSILMRTKLEIWGVWKEFGEREKFLTHHVGMGKKIYGCFRILTY